MGDPVEQPPRKDDVETTTREWIKALVFVSATAVLVAALLTWFAFTFVFHSCGTVPACG